MVVKNYMPFAKKHLFSLCKYRHNTAFYYREKLDIWKNSQHVWLKIILNSDPNVKSASFKSVTKTLRHRTKYQVT